MKKTFKYLLLFLTSVLFFSCENPLPTELISSGPEEGINIIPISSDPDIVYSNGYDSTGITSPVLNYSSVINLSFSKTTTQLQTFSTSMALAYFFDKDKPVKVHADKIIGYGTKTPGTVNFDKKKAKTRNYKIKYKLNGVVKDTSVGQYYILTKRGKSGDSFNFVHDSMIDFELETESSVFETEIPTPKEINGEIEISGNRGNNNLEFNLTWNGSEQDSIEIVIGGMIKRTKEVFPYFSFKTPDNGKLKIAASFLKNFPFDKYDKIVVTLIRKKIKEVGSDNILGDNYIVARSIHNIQVDVPK